MQVRVRLVLLKRSRGKNYVTLQGVANYASPGESTENETVTQEVTIHDKTEKEKPSAATEAARITVPPPVQPKGAELTAAIANDQRRKRVFITHGKNRDLVEPIRKLLEYGELEPLPR